MPKSRKSLNSISCFLGGEEADLITRRSTVSSQSIPKASSQSAMFQSANLSIHSYSLYPSNAKSTFETEYSRGTAFGLLSFILFIWAMTFYIALAALASANPSFI